MKTKLKQVSIQKGISQKDWKNVLELYKACMGNAKDLLTEAELLYSHNYFARAFALSIVAYEEVGKGQIVADLFNDMVSKEEFDEAFRRHEIKSAYNSRQFMINTKPLFSSHIDYDKSKGKTYNEWRISSTYVDYSTDYKAREPKNIITKENAWEAIFFVNKKIAEIEKSEYISERIGSKAFLK